MQLVLELAGHEVFTAGTAKEALERAAKDHPDAVLLDLHLPDDSGQSVSKALRAQGEPVPRIIITSGSSLEPADAARYGADAVLRKPFEPDAMLAALR